MLVEVQSQLHFLGGGRKNLRLCFVGGVRSSSSVRIPTQFHMSSIPARVGVERGSSSVQMRSVRIQVVHLLFSGGEGFEFEFDLDTAAIRFFEGWEGRSSSGQVLRQVQCEFGRPGGAKREFGASFHAVRVQFKFSSSSVGVLLRGLRSN